MAMNPGTQRQLVEEHIEQLKRAARARGRHQAAALGVPQRAASAGMTVPVHHGPVARRIGVLLVATGRRLGGLEDVSAGWTSGVFAVDHTHGLRSGC